MHRVFMAEPYRFGAMSSSGNASGMLIRQYQFPHIYTKHDVLLSADHDRLFQENHEHASDCFKKHIKDSDFIGWVRRASNEEIIEFLKDLLRVNTAIRWTGYRILGTVNRSNGYPIWSMQLFANISGVRVYTESDDPNVK